MFDGLSPLHALNQLMHAAEVRHRVISQNIANVNTPGYQAQCVEFESLLAERLRAGGRPASESIQPEIKADPAATARADGNSVDIDRECGRLQQNALLYQTYAQLLASYFDSMRRALRTG